MKTLTTYLYESCISEASDAEVDALKKKLDKVEKKADDAEDKADDAEDKADDAETQAKDADKEANKATPTIKDEKSFRAAAQSKFEKVFGDKLDKDKMKETVDGILKDNAEMVEKGDWGSLVGILNKSFGGH